MAGIKTIAVRPVEAYCPTTGASRGKFASLQDAAAFTGAHAQAIHRAIKAPGRWTAGGFCWRDWEGPPAPATKRCNRCKVELLLKHFRKHGNHRRHICTQCEVIQRREDRHSQDKREAAAARGCWQIFLESVLIAAGAKKV